MNMKDMNYEGEKLITAVIMQAVEDAGYQGRNKKYLKHKKSAIDWIVGNDPQFVDYCKMLGLCPAGIRSRIIKNVNMQYTKQQKVMKGNECQNINLEKIK